ncbi:MAG: mannosyltransferase family protein [cyanobacterium endosymbiont of Rhopalodia fuxianensis]
MKLRVTIQKLEKFFWQPLWFIIGIWLLSRGLILVGMLGIAPLLEAPSGGIKTEWGWGVFSAWDSNFYQEIATANYDGIGTIPGANVAFFPFFPLTIRIVMGLGLSAEVAGTLINNLAFLGTLFIVFHWVKRTDGIKTAQWTTTILAWCPLSLFTAVVYTEGLFLFLSTASLWAFDRQSYLQAAAWGTLATATRITGLALIPAFFLTAWCRRVPITAYVTSFGSALGVLLYSGYCWVQFNDPLAFITVQHTQWNRSRGIDWQGWGTMLVEITTGRNQWHYENSWDLLHPFLLLLMSIIAYALWHYRDCLGETRFDYSCCGLLFLVWLLIGDPLINTISVLGGIYLLWHLRNQLSFVVVTYGFSSLGLLLASGGTISLSRLAYGIISLSLGLGVLLSNHPRWGYAMIGFCTVLLVSFSIRFAQHLWVA